MMRQYEFMLVFRPDFDTKDTKKRDEIIHKLAGAGVALKEVVDMGKKRLSYPILKHEEGVYVLATLEAEAIKVGEIEKQTRLQTDVIRYLLTVKE